VQCGYYCRLLFFIRRSTVVASKISTMTVRNKHLLVLIRVVEQTSVLMNPFYLGIGLRAIHIQMKLLLGNVFRVLNSIVVVEALISIDRHLHNTHLGTELWRFASSLLDSLPTSASERLAKSWFSSRLSSTSNSSAFCSASSSNFRKESWFSSRLSSTSSSNFRKESCLSNRMAIFSRLVRTAFPTMSECHCQP
jgi:hypothetical protein